MKVLIVDDDENDRYMLEVLLRGHGYEVESAADGVEALEKASQNVFDMIISDILMPRMDGFQLCREVKTNERLKNIALVFYTATYIDPKDEEFALSLGAEKFIVKPTDPDVLVEILQEVVRSYDTGTLAAPEPPVEEETIYLKGYNERLIKKLEDKILELENANQLVTVSEQKYKELVDNANDALMIVEQTGYFGFVNPMFCEMTGYSMEEAKRINFSMLVHPEDLAKVTENFRRRLAGEEVPSKYEFQGLTKSQVRRGVLCGT
jgi:PAS domain S-box-containing protein